MLLAKSLAKKVNDDLVAQNGQYGTRLVRPRRKNNARSRDNEFGEINNLYINNEFDATIIEVAFHDNKEDAELMRDPRCATRSRGRRTRACQILPHVDDNETPATRLPTSVTGVHVETGEAGDIKISWVPPATNSYLGDSATGYRIYASTNGYGFDGGTTVEGGKSTSLTLKDLDPKTVYYFKVAAINEGGEFASV